MKRRTFIGAAAGVTAAAATGLSAPALGQGAAARTLRFVPQANLANSDPIWGTQYVVRNSSALVWDTLYGVNSRLEPKRQMVEGEAHDAGFKVRTFRLRAGLKFHDGEPVLSRDVVQSLIRWMPRDPMGQLIPARLDAIEAADDRAFRIRPKSPFPKMIFALGKNNAPMSFIMPERIAKTDPFQPITEIVGSGPMRVKRDGWVPGSRAVFERFADYVRREEAPDWLSGGTRILVDRIEWHILPEAATAAAALQNGEVDWWETPLPDLIPVLRRNRNIAVDTADPLGNIGSFRLNHLHPPFDNPEIGRALLLAVNQEDYRKAVVGDDPSMFSTSHSYWSKGSPMHTEAGAEPLKLRSPERARAPLQAAGCSGRKVVQLHASDFPTIAAQSRVPADLLRRLCVNLELVATDWGTVVQRRASREPSDRGGWNVFPTTWAGPDWFDPAAAVGMRTDGLNGWFGWPTSEKIEALRDAWFDAPNFAGQKRIAAGIQAESFQVVPHVPLGHFLSPSAMRRNVTGLIKSPVVLFDNMAKAA